MGWRSGAVSAFRRLGGLRLVEAAFGRRRVTVFAYHRVVDHTAPGFVGFAGNVSASPEGFAGQMSWVADRLEPVSLREVADAIAGASLPDRAALVTFDDGYRDNLTEALPVLDRLGIPAALFVATDHIGTTEPFWWDLVGWWFTQAPQGQAQLPLLGQTSWSAPQRVAATWIERAKSLPDVDRRAAVGQLGQVLQAAEPGDAFESVLLDWDEVRRLIAGGVAVGAHTCAHPILTRVPPERVRREVSQSVERVVEETGEPVLGFAYPNGQADDFDDTTRRAVADAGVPVAFTLLPGPARRSEVLDDPLAVRRVYVHHGDDMTRFAAKAAGVARLVGRR